MGHFRRLAAKECTTSLTTGVCDPLDNRCCMDGIKLAHRNIVHEEERSSTLHKQIIDGVIDQIIADGIVALSLCRNQRLGPHAIGGGDEDRTAHLLKGFCTEYSCESSDAS